MQRNFYTFAGTRSTVCNPSSGTALCGWNQGRAGSVATLVPEERWPLMRALPVLPHKQLYQGWGCQKTKARRVTLQVQPQIIVEDRLKCKVAGSNPGRVVRVETLRHLILFNPALMCAYSELGGGRNCIQSIVKMCEIFHCQLIVICMEFYRMYFTSENILRKRDIFKKNILKAAKLLTYLIF